MICVNVINNFENWRDTARGLLSNGIEPDEIVWKSGEQASLLSTGEILKKSGSLSVPVRFLELARTAFCFDNSDKFGLFYSIAYRLVNEGRDLLEVECDPEIRRLLLMEKAVRRDIHKFHAFVRFRAIEVDEAEFYVAWHEPYHFTVEAAAPFFVRRFGGMRFSIMTPKGCSHWDLKDLSFTGPAIRNTAPQGDPIEDLWLTYYRNIFNPFRLKIGAMKNEMPVRHWRTMPETALIAELVQKAGETAGKVNL